MGKDFYDTVYQFSLTAKGRRKKLAAFLLRSPNEAAMMTIEDIAEVIGVTGGMVSRAVRHMGFDGFADMQRLMRKSILKTLSPAARLRKNSSVPSCMESLHQDQENLAGIAALNSEESFANAAHLLAEARAVHVFALRSSYPLAYFLSLCLEQVREEVHLMELGAGRLINCLNRFKSGDAVVLISFPRYLKDSLFVATEARKRGCTTLAITDSVSSPLGLQVDMNLVSPYAGVSFFNSPAAAFALIGALITQTVNILGPKGDEELERFLEIQSRWTDMLDDVGTLT